MSLLLQPPFSHFFPYREHPPLLAKFCDPRYNIAKGSPFLKLGTLWEYKRTENEEIQDRDEGEAVLQFLIDTPQWRSFDWIRYLSGTNLYAGEEPYRQEMRTRFNGMVESLKIHECDQKRNRAKITCRVYGFPSVANCYVLSMSWIEIAGQTGTFSGYSDSWWVKRGEHFKFFSLLRHVAQSEIKKKPWFNANMRVTSRSEPVTYTLTNKVYNIEDEGSFSIAEMNEIADRVHFIKPIRFCREAEYRFVISIYHNEVEYNIPDEPLYIPASMLLQYVQTGESNLP